MAKEPVTIQTEDAHPGERAPIRIEADLDNEIFAPLHGVPDPPKAILERLRRDDKVWRWMSTGQVGARSMRGYEQYSATPEDREWARRDGRFRVDVENKLCWGADAFLGIMSRIRFEKSQAYKASLSADQTTVSKSLGQLTEMAERMGSKVTGVAGQPVVQARQSGAITDKVFRGD